MATFRVHPAFGIARVGDAPTATFIGPEMPGVPANWNFNTNSFDPFKDNGQIKRQGVRFRVFEFNDDGTLKGEALPGQGGIASIEWTVHVANRKAAFFRFEGPKGEDGNFSQDLRNRTITGSARDALVIDPGPQRISGPRAGPVVLVNPNGALQAQIPDLGELRTDDQGRLEFFGGHGQTAQAPGAQPITNYVNNDGWFDDVGDGPVSATVILSDGTNVEAVSAWVSVAPPDFAPPISNVVSLYDLMWDVSVRNPNIAIPPLAMFRPGGALEKIGVQRADWDAAANRFRTYRPSYVDEILDLLLRAFSARLVHAPPVAAPFHLSFGPQLWADLADPSQAAEADRQTIFKRLRDPDGQPANSDLMPRGLGDEYADETIFPPGSPERSNSKRFFSLTRRQYALMRQWAEGNFHSDGAAPRPRPAAPTAITPEGLDRAALENCVGGPFFPGIEVSWLTRNAGVYAEPFRIKPGARVGNLTVGPGFFTQQMAQPWHADFRDCKREPLTHLKDGSQTWAMWWAGQRPDDVYPEADPGSGQVRWTRAPHFNAGDDDNQRYVEMVQFWPTQGFVAKQIGQLWVETERT